jgi:hypothetical protein
VKSYTVVLLRAIHAQRAVVVKNQSIEAQRAARGECLRVEQLGVVVDVGFDLAWVLTPV